jgi:hypothetical protein
MTGSIAEAVLIAQVLASVGMFGVIWTIQLVHYPLMAHIPATAFVAYERRHTKAIALIVGPLMAVEGLCVLVVFFARPSGIPFWLSLIGGIAEAVAIGTTAFVSAPLHGRLENGFDAALISRLILTNWIRTVAWTARGIIAVAMLVLFL